MQKQDRSLETIAPRPASEVMRLSRMGCFHQHRLSFMRVLLRRLKSQEWRFEAALFDIDKQGVGVAVIAPKGQKIPILWWPLQMTWRPKNAQTG